jgi:hypothetical protein
MILDEIIMDEIVSENNVFRKDKDTVSKWGYQKDIKKITLKSVYQYIYDVISAENEKGD